MRVQKQEPKPKQFLGLHHRKIIRFRTKPSGFVIFGWGNGYMTLGENSCVHCVPRNSSMKSCHLLHCHRVHFGHYTKLSICSTDCIYIIVIPFIHEISLLYVQIWLCSLHSRYDKRCQYRDWSCQIIDGLHSGRWEPETAQMHHSPIICN